MYIMMVSEQGVNVGRAVLWYHLVCGWYVASQTCC